jgi:hypothetical protein
LIRPSMSSMLSLRLLEPVLVWYASEQNLSEIHTLIFIWQVFSPTGVIFAGIGILLSVRILLNSFLWAILTRTSLRQLRTLGQAMMHLSTFLSALKCFSDVSRSI